MSSFPLTLNGYPLPRVLHDAGDIARLKNSDLDLMDARERYVERLGVERAIPHACRDPRLYVAATSPPYYIAASEWLIARAQRLRELAQKGGDNASRPIPRPGAR